MWGYLLSREERFLVMMATRTRESVCTLSTFHLPRLLDLFLLASRARIDPEGACDRNESQKAKKPGGG